MKPKTTVKLPESNETERLLSEILKVLLKIEANTRRCSEL
jgi:hypothetical protein